MRRKETGRWLTPRQEIASLLGFFALGLLFIAIDLIGRAL